MIIKGGGEGSGQCKMAYINLVKMVAVTWVEINCHLAVITFTHTCFTCNITLLDSLFVMKNYFC